MKKLNRRFFLIENSIDQAYKSYILKCLVNRIKAIYLLDIGLYFIIKHVYKTRTDTKHSQLRVRHKAYFILPIFSCYAELTASF